MIELFNRSSQLCSKLITETYSTSFTLGIRTLHRKLHTPIYSIYGFVRLGDEIVDTFHDFDKKTLFERFERDTFLAIEEKISTNPILHAFQLVVNEYNINLEYIHAFLESMKMDLEISDYSSDKYEEYIYGSAEVVGLMCLKVFCGGNEQKFSELEEGAKRLGSAFQKVNFLRDIKSDYFDRGRMYFPNVIYQNFSSQEKENIEIDIENDFKLAYEAITNLPEEAKFGVLLAFNYYECLFEKIKKASVPTIQNKRIRVPNFQKITLLTGSILKQKLIG
ncbi:MAG: phytoene/squalene synthase family protein [Bacteroidota bacterium]